MPILVPLLSVFDDSLRLKISSGSSLYFLSNPLPLSENTISMSLPFFCILISIFFCSLLYPLCALIELDNRLLNIESIFTSNALTKCSLSSSLCNSRLMFLCSRALLQFALKFSKYSLKSKFFLSRLSIFSVLKE
ncbi:hypothetical protein D3C85_1317320 [compost metagenome]